MIGPEPAPSHLVGRTTERFPNPRPEPDRCCEMKRDDARDQEIEALRERLSRLGAATLRPQQTHGPLFRMFVFLYIRQCSH